MDDQTDEQMDDRVDSQMDDQVDSQVDDPVEAPSSVAIATAAPDPRQRQRVVLGLAAIAVLSCAAVVIARRHDSGGIEVVETGFSALRTSPYDVTYGVVVENRTDEIAYHTVACVELEATDSRRTGCERFTIEVLMPGQRVGFGALRYGLPDTGGASGISVEIEGPATWEDPDDHRWGPIVASNVELAYSPENEPVVAFDQESGYELDTVGNAHAYAVLRNADGDVIGGTGTEQATPVRPHERLRNSIAFDGRVDDVATAEAYIFPSGL